MIAPLLCLALQATKAPVIPPGLNKAFVNTAYAVEADLAAGHFDQAKEEAGLLPHPDIRLQWDDSQVPEEDKADFKAACERAVSQWQTADPDLHFHEGADPDIAFSFTGLLPKPEGSGLPAGADIEFQKGGAPRLIDRIALERMDPAVPINPTVVHNEVAFAIGQYLGLEEMPHFGGFATRIDQNTIAPTYFNTFEQQAVKEALTLRSALKELAAKQQAVTAAQPKMGLSTAEIKGVQGYQGEPLQISFSVYNSGNSDLELYVLPDCGCLSPQAPPVIKPNSSGTIVASVNTELYTGHLEHSLLIYSNSPDWSFQRIPVVMDVEPAYHFVQPEGSVYPLGPNGASFDLYMAVSSHAQLPVLTTSFLGAKASVQFHPWSGIVPGDTEEKGPIKGYKFHIEVAPVHDPGRIPATLMLGTANPGFREINCTINLQKGIVALPGQVYFGTVSKEPRTVNFIVSRAGGPFEIKSIDTGSPYLSAKVSPGSNRNELQVALTYSGKAEPGLMDIPVQIHLSDPEQPLLVVRAEADVK